MDPEVCVCSSLPGRVETYSDETKTRTGGNGAGLELCDFSGARPYAGKAINQKLPILNRFEKLKKD
jgi:hypothetical protein